MVNPNKTATNFTVGDEGTLHLDEESECYQHHLLSFYFHVFLLQKYGCLGVGSLSTPEILKSVLITPDIPERVSPILPFSHTPIPSCSHSSM